jgi:hypothetical protein
MTQEQRIEKLEQESRRFRRAGTVVLTVAFVALAVCVGLLTTGRAGAQNTPKPGIVTGSEFRLVDSSGMTRAVLHIEKNGQPLLRFLGEKGELRASIGLQDYGPSLFFARANGKPGTSIGVGGKGPSMAFADTAGHMRIMLHVDDSTGMPTIALRDTTGHTAWTAPEPPKK